MEAVVKLDAVEFNKKQAIARPKYAVNSNLFLFTLVVIFSHCEAVSAGTLAGELEDNCAIMIAVINDSVQKGDGNATPHASEAVQTGICMGYLQGLQAGTALVQVVLNMHEHDKQKYPACVFDDISILELANSFVRFMRTKPTLRKKEASAALLEYAVWDEAAQRNCPLIVERPLNDQSSEENNAGSLDSLKDSPTSPFVAAPRAVNTDPPLVKVANASSYRLILKVGRATHNIAARQSVEFEIDPGTHAYHASAAGVIPASGEETFQIGYQYSWKFTVVTTKSRLRTRKRR